MPSGTHAEFRGALEPLRIDHGNDRGQRRRSRSSSTVRISRHGPLVSDAINANNAASDVDPKPAPLEPLAFRWTALDEEDATVAAFLRLNEARNWTEFTAALRDFVVAVAELRLRRCRRPHRLLRARPHSDPRAAATARRRPKAGPARWSGPAGFRSTSSPTSSIRPSHFIVTANHRPVPPDYPYFIGAGVSRAVSARSASPTCCSSRRKLTPDDFRGDPGRHDLAARAGAAAAAAPARAARRHDRTASPSICCAAGISTRGPTAPSRRSSRPGSCELARRWSGDELGPGARDELRTALLLRAPRSSSNTLTSGDEPVVRRCDDGGAGDVRRGGDGGAARRGRRRSSASSAATSRQWRWDGVHRAIFPHQGLDAVGRAAAAAQPIDAERRRLEHGQRRRRSRRSAVRAARGPRLPADRRSVAGQRQPLPRCRRAVRATSCRRTTTSFLSDWQRVRHRPMRMDRAEIDGGAIGTCG